jgi:hypothetical protein
MKVFTSRTASLLVLVTVLMLNSSSPVLACAACYGDTSGSKQSVAAAWGIFAMVIIMFAMLGTLIGCGFYLRYRAQHPLPDYNELLNDDDQPKPGTNPL